MSDAKTTPFRISPFIAGEASGSAISQTREDSGYEPSLCAELERVGPRGGTVHLTAAGLRDLAGFLDAMEIANSQGGGMSGLGNPSGARSCRMTAERARKLAAELEGTTR